MNESEVQKLEQETHCFVVDGYCPGLYYFLSNRSKDRGKIAVAGEKGITILTREQAKNVAEDIMDVLNQYSNGRFGDKDAI